MAFSSYKPPTMDLGGRISASSAQFRQPVGVYAGPGPIQNIRQTAGNTVDWLSSKVGLPETGFSEFLAGGKTINSGRAYASEPSPTAPNSSTPPSSSNPLPNFPSNPQVNQFVDGWRYTGNQNEGTMGWVPPAGYGVQAPDPAEIDNAYNEAYNYINQYENTVRGGEQDFYNSYTQPFDAMRPQLTADRDTLLTGNRAQQGQVRVDEQNALSAARNLYNELQQNTRQRFGGVSSAGEVANVLLGRELQRNVGNAMNTAGKNIQTLLDKAQEIETGYQTKVQELEEKKGAALSQARVAFQDRLAQIAQTKAGFAQDKAAQKLQALREYRGYQQQIENAFIQQNMNLQSLREKAGLELQNSLALYRAHAGQPVNMAQFTNPTYSTYGSSQTPANAISAAYGMTAGARRVYNPLTGQYEIVN